MSTSTPDRDRCHRKFQEEKTLGRRERDSTTDAKSLSYATAFIFNGKLQLDDLTMYTLLILYALIAIGFSFFCSIAEAVLLSVTPSFIATLKDQGHRSAILLDKLKSNVDRPLSAILSLNTVAHTVGAAGVGAQAAEIWNLENGGSGHAVGWASAIMTLAILVLSEIIPKTLGAVYWRQLAGPIATMTNA